MPHRAGSRPAFALLLLAAALAWSRAGAAPALAQSSWRDAGTATSATLPFPSGNAAGNFIVVPIRAGGLDQVFTVTDTCGNTYRQALRSNVANDTVTVGIYYAENVAGGPNTITVSDTIAGGTLRFAILEYSGVATSNALDAAAAVAEGTSTAPASAPVSTTAPGALILGVVTLADLGNFSPGGGASIAESVPSPGPMKLAIQHRIQAEAGPVSSVGTIGSSQPWAVAVAAFHAAATGGPPVPDMALRKTHEGSFARGQTGATYTITARNAGSAASSGTVSVTDALPRGLTATAITGAGWSCALATLTCTRADALAVAASYPPITVTVNVSPTAPSAVANAATVSGGGQTNTSNDVAKDPTRIAAAAAPDLTLTKTHSGSFTRGQTGATYTLTVGNAGTAATSGTVSVTDTLPSGLTATAISGAGWSCELATLTCTRADALAPASSHPAITLTVDVSPTAPPSVTNAAAVSGGGQTNTTNDSASDPTTIGAAAAPDLTLTKSHSGSFTRGQTGASYTLAVANVGNAPTSGNVSVADTLPSGLTATAITGAGWSCALATLACSRADALAPPSSYPAITLTVDVSASAPSSVTNTASVSGGGQTNTANDAASDPTTITGSQAPDLTIAKTHSGSFSQGQTGATYTITVGNAGNAATSGTVGVADTLPSGLTATALTGSGWSCALSPLSCQRSDGLAASASYPAITLTVNVSPAAPSPVVNVATVSGGGQTNTSNDTASDPTTVGGSGASAVGQWSAVQSWPIVAVHAALLPTGDVLAWTDETATVGSQVWRRATNTFTPRPFPPVNLFCSAHAYLADGRLLVIGGIVGGTQDDVGPRETCTYDAASGTWTQTGLMLQGRYYPTAMTLPDGRVLAAGGTTTCNSCYANELEIYDPVTNVWTTMAASARKTFKYYPHLYVLPDGRVLLAAQDDTAIRSEVLDLSTQTWSVVDPRTVDGHCSAMYLPGKVMKCGRAAADNEGHPASNTTFVLDMTQASPAWQATANMAFPRTHHNVTILPDGQVLVTGGGRTTDKADFSTAVLDAEMWSPATRAWTTMARMQTPRLYHSTALLLPDATVLVAGGGRGAGRLEPDPKDQSNAEIYSPPYLFRGPRPVISSAPSTIAYGETFQVVTPDAARIGSVSLIPLSAVTHHYNESQRFVPASFTAQTGAITVTAPASGNIAPPGYYMLFLVDTLGVPSVSAMVRIP